MKKILTMALVCLSFSAFAGGTVTQVDCQTSASGFKACKCKQGVSSNPARPKPTCLEMKARICGNDGHSTTDGSHFVCNV